MLEPRSRGAALHDVHIPVRICKVDKERRLVTGIATAEVIDKSGEVMLYEDAKKAFQAWPGNIREMHDATKAVGKAVDMQFDDELKEIIVTSKISKGAEDTWQKVLDGTLGYYSVGGKGTRAIQKFGNQTATLVKMAMLNELSLVDNGCNPVSKINVVKMAGTVLEAEPTLDALTDDDLRWLDVEKRDVSQAERDSMSESDFAGKGSSFPIHKPADVAAAAASMGRAGDSNYDTDTIKANIIRIAYRKGDAFVAKLPESWKKDVSKCEPAQESDMRKSMDTETKPVVAEPVADAPVATEVLSIRKQMETYDVQQALQVLLGLQQLIASEYTEAMMGEAGDDAHVAVLRSAANLLISFIQSEFEEQFTEEGTTKVAKRVLLPVDAARLTALGDVIDKGMPILWARLDTKGEVTFAKGLIEKKGARHSKSDNEMIQKMHDHSVALGAACKEAGDVSKLLETAVVDEIRKMADGGQTVNAPGQGGPAGTPAGTTMPTSIDTNGGGGAAGGGVTETVTIPASAPAPGEAIVKAVDASAPAAGSTEDITKAVTESITKIVTDAIGSVTTSLGEIKTTTAAQAETIVKLQGEIEDIKKIAVPGGPSRVPLTPVEKTIGGPTPAATDMPSEAEVRLAISVLENIAKSSSATDIVKELAAAEVLKIQQRTGYGAGTISFNRP